MNAWVVIPVYEEAATLGEVVTGARRYAPVLVVDDGSGDDSSRVARAAGAEVIRHPRRLGKGQALRSGAVAIRQRGASHMLTMDGDGQHAPDDVPRLLATASEHPEAIVVGCRLGGARPWSVLGRGRHNAVRVAGFFLAWASGLALCDTQSGFRVYPLDVLERLSTCRGGFVFETEVLMAAAAAGVAVREVAVKALGRTHRRSRFRPLMDGAAIGAYLARGALAQWVRAARSRARGDAPERARGLRAAAVATALSPLLLGAAVLQALLGSRGVDVVTPLVDHFFSVERLGAGAATPLSEVPAPTGSGGSP